MKHPKPYLATSALLGLLLLSACGGATEKIAAPSTSPTVVAISSEASAPASSDESVPAGYQLLKAPKHKIAIPVPEDWVWYNSQTDFTSDAEKENLEALRVAMRADTTDQVISASSDFDAMAISKTPNEKGISDTVGFARATIKGETDLPTEEVMKKRMEYNRATLTDYRRVQTPNGDVVIAEALVRVMSDGTAVKGIEIIMPSGVDGEFTAINVNTSSEEYTRELADFIAQNWRKTA